MTDKKKFNYMENTLQAVLNKTVSLNEKDVKANNVILQGMTSQLIEKVKEDSLFKLLYKRNFYGGSFYDGLKIEKPEEFDLDLILVFPKNTKVELQVKNDLPGFVSAQVVNPSSELKCILDGEYLNPHKVLQWMEKAFTKAIQQFPMNGSQYVITINEAQYLIKICKNGPAFTVKLTSMLENLDSVYLDVDLVPCFLFEEDLWPSTPFRKNPSLDKKTFFIVPKIPKNFLPEQSNNSWRLSFQEQEREMIKGFKNLKPVLKLIKKLRDKLEMKIISSYYIKTVFLWEVAQKEHPFWENSLSYVFMEMLTIFTQCLTDKKIAYFWNEKNNLIKQIDEITLSNYSNRLRNIVASINKSEDTYCVAKYFFGKHELEKLTKDGTIKKLAESTSDSPPRENGSLKQNDYNAIVGKLAALHEESKDVSKSLRELKEDNKTLLNMMLTMTDKLSVLESKCSYLEQQFNRAK